MVNGMIRSKCPDIIINNTTGGSVGMTVEERLACLNANPEIATINIGPDMYQGKLKARPEPLTHPRPEMLLDDCMPVTYSEVTSFAKAMKERGIKPELEVYHPGLYWPVWDLIDKKLIEKPYLIQHVMGYMTSSYPTAANLISLMNELPDGSIWEVSGLGPFQLPIITLAIVLGAQIVRVGMEDNIYRRRGQLLKDNREAVEQVIRIASELNREIATPTQAREMLGLSQSPSIY
jgi:3-keto-5-aminohexanoate cleavage enzyme